MCSKCLTPIGDDAVFLRNGTYMCPSCYQYYYPARNIKHSSDSGSQNAKGILAILAVIGIFAGIYVAFDYFAGKRRETTLEEKKAQESRDRRKQEEAEALSKGPAKEEAAANATGNELAQAEAAKRAKAAETAEAERLKRIEEERLKARVEFEEKTAEQFEKQRKQNDAALLANQMEKEKERSKEIAGLAKRIVDAQKVMTDDEKIRGELVKKIASLKVQIQKAQDTRATLLRQHNADFRAYSTDPNDVGGWRAATGGRIGGRIISADLATEYGKLVGKFDEAWAVIQTAEVDLQRTDKGLQTIERSMFEAKMKFDEVNRRLTALNATAVELAGAGVISRTIGGPSDLPAEGPKLPPPPPPPPLKTILKKDGTTIKALAIMSIEDEVRYKDEAGKWQSVPKTEVEKIQQ